MVKTKKRQHRTLKKIREDNKIRFMNICGIDLLIMGEVFSPYHFRASEWMTNKMSKIVGKKRLLEVGTGTGITAIKCAKNGAEVVATDISPISVKNARINALINNTQIDIRKSDVYSNIKRSEKFDFIFWNHPFDDKHYDIKDELSKSIYDPGYKNTKKFIKNGKLYLKKNGRILLGTGMNANFSKLKNIAKNNNLYMREIIRETLSPKYKNSSPYDILLLEFSNQKKK